MKKVGMLWRVIQWGLLLTASALLGGIIAAIVLFDVMTFPALIMIGVGLTIVGFLFGAGFGMACALSENEYLQAQIERLNNNNDDDSDEEDDEVDYRKKSPRTPPLQGVYDRSTWQTSPRLSIELEGKIAPPNTPIAPRATTKPTNVPLLPLGQLSFNLPDTPTPKAPRGERPRNSFTDPNLANRLESNSYTPRSSSMPQLSTIQPQPPSEEEFIDDIDWEPQASSLSSTNSPGDGDSYERGNLKTPRKK